VAVVGCQVAVDGLVEVKVVGKTVYCFDPNA
jgi:hypothetical protein